MAYIKNPNLTNVLHHFLSTLFLSTNSTVFLFSPFIYNLSQASFPQHRIVLTLTNQVIMTSNIVHTGVTKHYMLVFPIMTTCSLIKVLLLIQQSSRFWYQINIFCCPATKQRAWVRAGLCFLLAVSESLGLKEDMDIFMERVSISFVGQTPPLS